MDKFIELDIFTNLILENEGEKLDELFKGNYQKGVEVYQNNYFYSLLNVLKNKYEVTLKILGDENFNFFCRDFIKLNPSKNPNIDEYGKGLGEYFVSREELSELGYIGYICALDSFWFDTSYTSQKSLTLPQGVLSLWGKLKNDLEIEGIEIDESNEERISLIEEDGEYQLRAQINT